MEQEQIQVEPAIEAPETFPLDDAAISMIAEIHQQMEPLNIASQAILSYFARQHSLQGKWMLAPNKRELIKAQ